VAVQFDASQIEGAEVTGAAQRRGTIYSAPAQASAVRSNRKLRSGGFAGEPCCKIMAESGEMRMELGQGEIRSQVEGASEPGVGFVLAVLVAEMRFEIADSSGSSGVKLLAAVQQGNDHAGIEQNRFHRPKSRKCFLLEPRSEIPVRKRPKPMTPCFFRRKRVASRMRRPSRTTCEGVQPSSRTSAVRRFRERSSSLA
jgi:hypothetical protein